MLVLQLLVLQLLVLQLLVLKLLKLVRASTHVNLTYETTSACMVRDTHLYDLARLSWWENSVYQYCKSKSTTTVVEVESCCGLNGSSYSTI